MFFPNGERGSALLELAIVIPTILLVSLMGLDVGKGLELHQAINTLSKELANIIYRDCAPYAAILDDPTMQQKFEVCVDQSVLAVSQEASNVLPDAVLVGSVFRKNKQGPPIGRNRRFKLLRCVSSTGDTRDALGTRKSVLKALRQSWFVGSSVPFPRVVVIGEVFYAHASIVPIFQIFSADRKMYSVTMF